MLWIWTKLFRSSPCEHCRSYDRSVPVIWSCLFITNDPDLRQCLHLITFRIPESSRIHVLGEINTSTKILLQSIERLPWYFWNTVVDRPTVPNWESNCHPFIHAAIVAKPGIITEALSWASVSQSCVQGPPSVDVPMVGNNKMRTCLISLPSSKSAWIEIMILRDTPLFVSTCTEKRH